MIITQEIINEIIERAKSSDLGLMDKPNLPIDIEKPPIYLDIEQYSGRNFATLALLLVSAYDAKYDLVSIFQAAMEVIEERTLNK